MRLQLDRGLLLVIFFFLGLGLVQVYSSSFIFATESQGDGLFFFRRQMMFTLLGIAALTAFAMIPLRHLERWGFLLWFAAVLALTLTFVPGLGIKAGGAARWIRLPSGMRFEPSELLKIAYPVLLATLIARPVSSGRFGPWALRSVLILVPLALLLKQPDFGSFVICTAVILGLLFAFGLKWRYIAVAVLVSVPAFYVLVVQVPYRYARISAFLDPWADPAQKGFQIIQSMLSFHAGGLWGVGLGQGQGKLFFLPEAHTDFALAVLAEETGFIGVAFVALLFGFVIYRGLQIALRADRPFPRALALGVTLTLALSVFVNMAVVMGLLPTKGLTLPFLSYGGSSLVCTCIGLGLLLNIDRANRTGESQSFNGYKIPA